MIDIAHSVRMTLEAGGQKGVGVKHPTQPQLLLGWFASLANLLSVQY